MDEPTNHLDIDSKEVLEDALINYDGTVIVVSHDRYFLNKVTNKIFDMSSDGLFEYLGNYDYYVEKKAELEQTDEEEIAGKTKTQINAERKKERELRNTKKQREKQIKEIENNLELCENEIALLEDELCQPSTYNDKNKVLELNGKLDGLKIKHENLYMEWSAFHEE